MGGRRLLLCLVTCMQVLVGAGARPPVMYVFGSSIVDVGNNNYLPGVEGANRPFNGIDFPGSIPTGRFSNGYNTADYVAKNMGFGLSPPAYLSLAPNDFSLGLGPLVLTALSSGINYASRGAGILDSTNAGKTIPLSKQLQYFDATKEKMVAAIGASSVVDLLSKSIFLVNIGDNDFYVFGLAQLARNRSAEDQWRDATALHANLISNYSDSITKLYSMGARKLAFINVLPLGCAPLVRVRNQNQAGTCWGLLNQLAGGFNDALRSLVAGLAPKLPGLVYSIADFYGFTQDVLADPAASGFTDIADACCGSGRMGAQGGCTANSRLCADRDRYVFWDLVHPSQRTGFLAAQAFYDGPAKYTSPINFKQLVQCSPVSESIFYQA